ncbi:TetR/AcrR family transcriptional regulator [Paenibacillus sp. GCM10023252]|uniref:TetR/AcrR family transcriptional regulator n=1 Tax=Paenibacillus sp. GCM10023252 TaxID=3252649 RepID=UPI003616BE53
MKRNKEDTSGTIDLLIRTGRQHFTARGYAGAALEEIVQEAQLTRGAVYHHFRSKRGLFEAVLEAVQRDVAERVEFEASKTDDPWEQLVLGCRTFVAAAVEPYNKRIMLIDGPAVLGWEAWRRMDERNAMRLLRDQLEEMQQQGYLVPLSIEAITHLISGALNEFALWLAHQPDADKQLEEQMSVITLMLEGFRVRG